MFRTALALRLALAVAVVAVDSRAQGEAAEFARLFGDAVRAGVAADEPNFRRAVQLLDEAAQVIPGLPADRRDQARFFVGVRKAEVYLHAGLANSDPALRKRAREAALEVRRQALAAGRETYAGYYRVLLLTFLRQTMADEAFAELIAGDETEFLLDEKAEAVVRQRGSQQLYAPFAMLRADVYRYRGDTLREFAELQHLGEEIRSGRETPAADWRNACLSRLVWYLMERQDWDRAELYVDELTADQQAYPRALIALRREDYPTVERQGEALTSRKDAKLQLLGFKLIGEAKEAQEAYDEARTAYRKALSLAADDTTRAQLRYDLGDCDRKQGRLESARNLYEEAFAQLSGPQAKYLARERADALCDLGLLAEAEGRFDVAFEQFATALDELEAARRDLPIDPLGGAWLRGHEFGRAVDGVIRTCRAAGRDLFDAFAAVEQGKARGLLDWMHQPPVTPELARVEEAVRSLALVIDPAQLVERQRALERARALAQKAGVRTARSLDAASLRDMVNREPGTAWLWYWVGEASSWVFVARGAELICHELGTRDAALEALRGAYVAAAERASDPAPALEAAGELFLPDAVRQHLRGAARIVFCPDGHLSRLPFEALPVDGQSLGLSVVVEWAPSLSARAMLAARVARGGAAVVVDSVEMDPEIAARLGLDPLAHSAAEGERVAGTYGLDVHRLRGANARLSALATVLEEHPASILHINSHAVASPFVPSKSLLLLADGPVSMASLARLQLQGTVVVLSACVSATGESRGGEGVAGLLWGPMAAGARAVVASLWPVHQEATAELMGEFHTARAQGLGEAAALRAARAALASTARFSHPYYWAGFVAFGSRSSDPEADLAPLGVSWTPIVLGAVAACAVLLLIAILRRRL